MPVPARKSSATQREWEDLAELDPLWAILTHNQRQFGKWDVEEFFAAGQREIDDLMSSCGYTQGTNGRVLDFGCGVGRLSRALLSYFGEVYGVDISDEMIRLAKEHTPSCTFLTNQSDNLSVFPNDFFDFLYSNIVLQHQGSKELVRGYIREFVRVTKAKGTIAFQIPYKLTLRQTLQPRRRLYSILKRCGLSRTYLYNRLHLNPMRTICLSSRDVEATISGAGGRLLRSFPDNCNVHSMTYLLTKD